jgi:hypothetical protein
MMRLNLSAIIHTSLVCTALAGCIGAVDEDTERDGTSAALSAGDVTLTRQGSGKCLDVSGGGTSNGTKVQQWTCNGTGAQTFRLEAQGSAYVLKNTQANKCAVPTGNGSSNGTQIVLGSCSGSSAKFKVEGTSGGYEHLVHTRSGKCLDVNGAASNDGGKVQLWTCNNTAAQNWKLADVTGGDGDTGDGDGDTGDGDGDGDQNPGDNLVWRKANLTNFTSYPDPGSEECIEFNGCTWAGQFAFVDEQEPESWVKSHNIIAVHSRDAKKYKLKTLRLRQGSHQIDATVYDMCSDSDCDGCCTENASETGFLIDIEKYTMQRFGSGDGIVDWACLDCDRRSSLRSNARGAREASGMRVGRTVSRGLLYALHLGVRHHLGNAVHELVRGPAFGQRIDRKVHDARACADAPHEGAIVLTILPLWGTRVCF